MSGSYLDSGVHVKCLVLESDFNSEVRCRDQIQVQKSSLMVASRLEVRPRLKSSVRVGSWHQMIESRI